MEHPFSGWSLLDPEARAAALALAMTISAPVSELGPTAARKLLETPAAIAPTTPISVNENLGVPTRDGEVRARLYRDNYAQDSPALLYLHGGGFVLGTLNGVDELCRAISARSGWTVISLEYRLAPEHPYPAALQDTVDTFAWIRSAAHTLGVDPKVVAVAGDSAGGNLAAALCLACRAAGGPMPTAQILIYPAVDNEFSRPSWSEFANAPLLTREDAQWFFRQYVGTSRLDPPDPLAAPMHATSLRQLPPALVLTAEVDPLRDDAEAYAARLADDGIPTVAIRYGGVFHGFVPEIGLFPQAQRAIDDICQYLRWVATGTPVRRRHHETPGQSST